MRAGAVPRDPGAAEDRPVGADRSPVLTAVGPPAGVGPAGRLCDPSTDPGWADLADRSGSLFHAAPWMRVLADAYGLRPRAILFGEGEPGGAGVGGLAWAEVVDPRGRRVVSLPFSDLAGPIGELAALDGILPGHLEPTGLVPLTMRIRLATADGPTRGAVAAADGARLRALFGLTEVDRLAWHWTRLEPLPDDAELGTPSDPQWAALAGGARQNVRRSDRSGVRLEVRNDVGALDEYHRLHRRLRRTKYRLLSQPRSFFLALHRHFGPDRLRVVLARLDGDPAGEAVAGVVLLRHGDHAYYKLNASTSAGRSARANDAVMWESMVQARRWGCHWFDFGVSDLDQPGLVRYKDKYATGRGEVVVLRRTTGPRPWIGRQVDRILPLATRAATDERCPDIVGRQAGRVLYRWFC